MSTAKLSQIISKKRQEKEELKKKIQELKSDNTLKIEEILRIDVK